jgi:hypothetical protein
MSVDLSVSSQKVDKNCKNLIKLLMQNNVVAKVTPNTSINPDGLLENGCTVRLPRKYGEDDKKNIKSLWETIRVDNFNCAHLQIFGKFDGCISDYLRPSKCSQYSC